MLSIILKNRYLLHELVIRDIRTRYIGSVVGIFWSILNPILQLTLYTLVFSVVLQIRFGEEGSAGHFAAYLFCGLLPWMAIQESTTRACRTFIEHGNLIKKVRFPLEVLPLSVVSSAFIHQLLGTAVFLAVLAVGGSLSYRTFPLVFLLFVLQLLMMWGLAMMAACLNVFFRDILQILGVIFMLLFWMTPIVYPKSRAPEAFELILNLNPLTHLVEAYRFAFLGDPRPSAIGLLYWSASCIAAFAFGQFLLRRTRSELVDLI